LRCGKCFALVAAFLVSLVAWKQKSETAASSEQQRNRKVPHYLGSGQLAPQSTGFLRANIERQELLVFERIPNLKS
jgi:hypothetical protein